MRMGIGQAGPGISLSVTSFTSSTGPCLQRHAVGRKPAFPQYVTRHASVMGAPESSLHHVAEVWNSEGGHWGPSNHWP